MGAFLGAAGQQITNIFVYLVGAFYDFIAAVLPSSQGLGPEAAEALYSIIQQTRIWGILIPFSTMFQIIAAVIVFEGFLLGFKLTSWVIGIASKFFGVRV